MTTVKIVTDSTAELTKEEAAALGVTVVPLHIQIDEEGYTDGIDIDGETFIDKMKAASELPKSSQPPAGVFQEVFDRLGADGSPVLAVVLTGGMSGTVKSAEAAADMSSADVTVIDSRYISYALAFQVREAAKMAKEGASVEAILERLEHVRRRTTLFVVVDVLDNLVKGGRIGKGKALVGSLLSIKPIAELDDGVYNPVAKARSTKQVVRYLFDRFKEDTAGKLVRGIGIPHARGLAMAEPLFDLLKADGQTNIEIGFTSPTVSTHTGPGAIGFAYYCE